MDGKSALDLLATRGHFTEDRARDIADALGIVWDGRAKWTSRDGQIVYSAEALENSFKNATRCRPLGGLSER